MVDSFFSRASAKCFPATIPQSITSARSDELSGLSSLTRFVYSEAKLYSPRPQIALSLGRKSALNSASLSPDSITTRSAGSIDSRRSGSSSGASRKDSVLLNTASDFSTSEAGINNNRLSPVNFSATLSKGQSNMDHLRRRSSFAIERLTGSKGSNSPGSNTPTPSSAVTSMSGRRSASPASPLNPVHSSGQAHSPLTSSPPSISPSSGSGTTTFSSLPKNANQGNSQEASTSLPSPPLPCGLKLSSNPKIANQQLLQSIQKYQRGGPNCRGPFAWKRNGRRHHDLPPNAVPYPLAVDREALDLDVIDNTLLNAVNGSLSLLDYKVRPKPRMVLDIGCGSGSWIMAVAPEWPECRFVGFDCLPLQANVSAIKPDLAKRVQWVRGNFLKPPMPFPDEYFDYVHIKQIGKAVPEDKWDLIFEEIARVLKPGGVVEVIEEDILFPHVPPPPPRKPKRHRKNKPLPPPPLLSPAEYTSSPDAPNHPSNNLSFTNPFSPTHLEFPSSGVHTPPSSSSLPLSSTGSQGSHDTESKGSQNASDALARTQSFSSQSSSNPSAIPPSPYEPSQNIFDFPARRDTAFSAISASFSDAPQSPSPPPAHSSHPSLSHRPPSQLVSAPITASNPDDRLLERLYFAVYERRFINLQPTSLIASLLNIHFKKTLTSPPICRYMPARKPRRRKRTPASDGGEKRAKQGTVSAPLDGKSKPWLAPMGPETILKDIASDGMPDDIAKRVKLILGYEETAAIHLYRVLSCEFDGTKLLCRPPCSSN
ncbi:hypothetical protein FRC02_011388 [Tulasnella sp. 418]|nr:hypothetical protein FRC02_011388 [Tulasnella sp. 418]